MSINEQLTWISSGSLGQSPGVLFPPSELHELVEMQVPLVLPTLQVFGDGFDVSLVQHYII